MKLGVEVKNFRSIKSTRLELKSGVNILIGPNGSGKTCMLSALKFIRDVVYRGAGLAIARNGGALRTYRRNESKMTFFIEYSLGLRSYKRRKVPFNFSWHIELAKKGKENITSIVREQILITAEVNNKSIKVLVLDFDRQSNSKSSHHLSLLKHDVLGKDFLSFHNRDLDRLTKPLLFNEIRKEISSLAKAHQKNEDKSFFPTFASFDTELQFLSLFFLNLNEYNIIPNVARQSTDQLPYAEMLPNGEDLSEVIHALVNREYSRIGNPGNYDIERSYPTFYSRSILMGNYYPYTTLSGRYFPRMISRGQFKSLSNRSTRTALESINTELAAAVAPIEGVSSAIDQTNGKRFVVFKAGKNTFYPEEVSDGTIKWLCILVSIFVPFSTIYLLEEPENFLHPWMQQRLISIMREQAERNKTIYLLTTHSSTILNSAQIDEVVIIKHDNNAGTTATAVHNEKDIRNFLEESNFGLGDLWVSGAIGGVPGSHD